MKLPSFRKLYKQDYKPEEQDFVEKLASSLNYGIEILYSTLNRQVSLRENVLCVIKDVDVIVNSSGEPTTDTSMRLDLSGRVEGLTVLKVENLTTSDVYPTAQPFITYEQTESSIIFNNIAGLSANYKWRLRVVAYLTSN